MIFFDTETMGFHGPIVLIQWAEDEGPIQLWNVWKNPVRETIALIESFTTHPGGVCGFNLAFDWFHLCQLYTTLLHLNPDEYPEDLIQFYAESEMVARDGPCLKPVTACDLMLHARKGPYQSTMDRGEIRIRKVPTVLAFALAQELERRVPLKDIYFAKRKNRWEPHWKIFDRDDSEGEPEPDFKDIVLRFHPSNALKALAVDALGIEADKRLLFTDVDLPKQFHPVEDGYAPYAMAHWKNGRWNGAWPDWAIYHIDHWEYNSLAREYAERDVDYTRRLWHHFGQPSAGDDDSVLACMVGACRWRGYKIDIEGIKRLRSDAVKRKAKFPTAPAYARRYIEPHLSETERIVIKGSTRKVLLEEIAAYDPLPCESCNGDGCPTCNENGYIPHPAAIKAKEVLEARKAGNEIQLYDKLLKADRFHASFVVIGTLSSRMAGTDDLNAQGIKKAKVVREKFPLAWPGYTLCGGDFSGFEVVLADAVYNDPDLRKDLLSGKKIHALFGVFVYPHMSYEQILASDGTSDDKYTRAKSAVFAMLYGGEGYTLKERLGVPLEIADAAYERFCRRYPGVGRARQTIIQMFQTLKQAGGVGTRITYEEPADYIESLFGFRRYFTLENMIVKALIDLATKPPPSWKDLKVKVFRREREQFAHGAVQSAIYGAAFALQAANMRAAANHVIQSSGATITKMVQRKIWELQPSGVNDWLVQPMNIHDEIMCPTAPKLVDSVAEVVHDAVESVRPKVPLIKMEWNKSLTSWADKGK